MRADRHTSQWDVFVRQRGSSVAGEIANVQIPFGTVSYTRLFKRALLGRSSLSEVAFHQEVLCPEEKATIHPAISSSWAN